MRTFDRYTRTWSRMKWSRRVGLNHRPTVYETVALPLSYAGSRKEVLCEWRVYSIKTSRHHISCGIHCQPVLVLHSQVTPQPLVSLYQHYISPLKSFQRTLLWRIPGTPCVICLTRFWQLFLYTLFQDVLYEQSAAKGFSPLCIQAERSSSPAHRLPWTTVRCLHPLWPHSLSLFRVLTSHARWPTFILLNFETAVGCKTAVFRLIP